IKAPSLYKHYKGKEDILNALIDSAEARYEELFGSENHIGKIPENREEFIEYSDATKSLIRQNGNHQSDLRKSSTMRRSRLSGVA
ncbi:MAG: hypothetical protein K5870_08870, partial [Lachnospiraceae bacterium]|nr:hypothetical protein [Lachnospiraceae bacterium]